jgi:glycosyltransferase involved in cell wall biosynthesis
MINHPPFPKQLVEYLKRRFNLDIFIETGTYLGGTAFDCSQIFKRVITMEASRKFYEAARQRYAHVPNIEFVYGSSSTQMYPVVQTLNVPAFFWLDAHWSGGETYGEKDECPLIAELEAINTSALDHFILIDDARLFMTPPPPPHDPDQWPGLLEIMRLLEKKNRYVTIYQDRFLAVPLAARSETIRFFRNQPVEQIQSAAEIFKYLLDADDIEEAITEKTPYFSRDLLVLIDQNIHMAKANDEKELVEGLEALKEVVAQKIELSPQTEPQPLKQQDFKPQARIEAEMILPQLINEHIWREGTPLKLHLGCGENHFDGYVNIDYPPDEHTVQTNRAADIFADITQLAFPPGTVDEVRSHHVFEHFDRSKALAQIIRWTSWLKMGGTLTIETPDFWGSIESLISKPEYVVQQGILRHIFGSHEASWAYHYDGWYEEKFIHVLSCFGYEVTCRRWKWPHPPYLANIVVTATKNKDIAYQDLLKAADGILAESMVANVPEEQKMSAVWSKNLRDHLPDILLPQPKKIETPASFIDSALMGKKITENEAGRCVTIVFSKDRPMQLDASLTSLKTHEKSGPLNIQVLYTTSDANYESLYETLKTEHPDVTFNREQDFKRDLIRLVKQGEYVLFLVDDNLFVRDFSLKNVMHKLKDWQSALGCSLRLGKNSQYFYMMDREQSIPRLRPVGETLCLFDWTKADGDFAYPLEVSSSVYRMAEVALLLENIQFNTPNSLEARMAAMSQAFVTKFPNLLCYETSATFCAPVNKVQNEAYLNRSGRNPDYSPANLAAMYRQGQRINAGIYGGMIPRGVHQEVELKFNHKDEKTPLVSVIIPCYNYGQYLKSCVDSLNQQTFTDFEVLIVNDGSTDNSEEVARQLIATYPQMSIQLINQDNSGQPAISRNNGIHAARGQYILPLDADDYLDKRMITACVQILEQQAEIAIVSTDAIYFDENTSKRVNALEFNPQLLPYQNHLSYCSLYRYAVWESVGGYRSNVRGYEDWDFWIASSERGYHVYHLAEALFYYRVKPGGVYSETGHHERELRAQMMINNPKSYRQDERDWAARLVGGQKRVVISNRPLVSVIMPTHNRRKELLQAVESVLKQTYSHFELIIINDAGEEVKNILPSDERIRYTRLEKNQGAGGARNRGFELVKGEYVAFLDDDDCYYPEHLETLVGELEKNPQLGAVYSDAMQVEWRAKGNSFEAGNRRVVYSQDFSVDQMLVLNYIPNLCLMLRAGLLKKAGGFDETLSALEDWEWLIRCVLIEDFKHIHGITAEYQVRVGGQSRNMLQPDVMLDLYITIYTRYALYASSQVMTTQAQVLQNMTGRTIKINGYETPYSRARLIFKRILEADDVSEKITVYKNELDQKLIEVIRQEQKKAESSGDGELKEGLLDLEHYIVGVMGSRAK